MERFALGFLLGAAVALAVSAPWVAPWPIRLRLLLAGQTPDPFLGLSPLTSLDMSEVEIVDVLVRGDSLEVAVAAPFRGSGPVRTRLLVTALRAPGRIAQLEGWCAVRIPLLLIIEEGGGAQLCGPDATLTGFRNASARV